MTTIAGIDPSLTRTGVALLAARHNHTPVIETHTITTTGHRAATITTRHQRIHHITRTINDNTSGADLVVIEGPSLGQFTAGTWDRAGLWWHIVAAITRRATPVAIVPPKTRAKWATDDGNADKHAVYAATENMWGPLWTPEKRGDDNEADALVLAAMGAQWLRLLPFPAADHQRAALTHAQWPQPEGLTA